MFCSFGQTLPIILMMIMIRYRGVAQPGSASALGAEGRRFESCRPDHFLKSFCKKGLDIWYNSTINKER